MKYFTLPNLSTQEVTPYEVDNLSTTFPTVLVPDYVRSKEEYMEYSKIPTTKYCFYSVIQGLAPNIRINKENPPALFFGYIADYDSMITIDERTITEILKRGNPSALPTFITRTYSGRARLIWLFAIPMRFFSIEFYNAFIKLFIKEAKVKQLLPGFDDNANRETQYFALGTDWTRIGPSVVSQQLLYYWAEKVSSKVKWKQGDAIPLDTLKEELDNRWPGRWQGNFELGSRGLRFWDESADNDTSAVVREGGMQCYTGDKDFMTWGMIFGRNFVEKYAADQIGGAISKMWFDGKEYWRETEEGILHPWNKQDTAEYLAGKFGLQTTKEGNENLPEVKRAIQAVHEFKLVDAAVPLCGRGKGVFYINGNKILNTNKMRPIQPVQCSLDEATQGCKFTLAFLRHFFREAQLPYYLSWLRRGYLSHLHGSPLPGQNVIVAGAVGIGKTFNSHQIVGKLFGGATDASEFLMKQTNFNEGILPYSIWTIDDNTPSSDPKWHKVFSAMLKMMAANRTFIFNAKFRKSFPVEWMGRVIITCNADPESLRVLPDTDMGTLDKFMMFMAMMLPVGFKIPGDVEKILEAELPYFGRYLQLYEDEEQCTGNDRFGTVCYHHPDLLDNARGVSSSAAFLELLRVFLCQYFSHNREKEAWEGTATDLMVAMMADDGIKDIASKYKTTHIGMGLGQIMAQGLPIKQKRTMFARLWVISREMVQ